MLDDRGSLDERRASRIGHGGKLEAVRHFEVPSAGGMGMRGGTMEKGSAGFQPAAPGIPAGCIRRIRGGGILSARVAGECARQDAGHCGLEARAPRCKPVPMRPLSLCAARFATIPVKCRTGSSRNRASMPAKAGDYFARAPSGRRQNKLNRSNTIFHQ